MVVLQVKAAAERQDHQLEADLGTLINGCLDRLLVCVAHMHHERVFRDPGGNGPIHFADSQAASFTFRVFVGQHPGSEGFKLFARRDRLGRSKVRTHLEQARRFLLVVHLRVEIGVGQPTVRTAVRPRSHHAAERHIGLNMHGRRCAPGGQLIDLRDSLDNGQHFT